MAQMAQMAQMVQMVQMVQMRAGRTGVRPLHDKGEAFHGKFLRFELYSDYTHSADSVKGKEFGKQKKLYFDRVLQAMTGYSLGISE